MWSKVLLSLLPLLGLARSQTPAEFTPLPTAGGGGNTFRDAPRFRIYGDQVTNEQATDALNLLEAAHTCFVDDLGWRSTGLSYNDNTDSDGPWYKTNIYGVSSIGGGAAGVIGSDENAGVAFILVVLQFLRDPGVVVHEWGHALNYHEKTWVYQGRTGAWWETFAEWVADTFKTSESCRSARDRFGIAAGTTNMNFIKVVGDSFQVIVDGTQGSGNYYQAYPFLSYLTYNPDGLSGLGTDTVREMNRQYAWNSNETPLHALERVASGTTVQRIVGRYWAHMAYGDIGHPQSRQTFLSQRGSINFNNLAEVSPGVYRVILERQPRYMGSNITPLRTSGGSVSVNIQASQPYTATVAIRDVSSGNIRYIDVVNNVADFNVGSNEESSLIVANTPSQLILYDGFNIGPDASMGMDYTVQLTGATI